MSQFIKKSHFKSWLAQPSTKGALFNTLALAVLGGASVAVPSAESLLVGGLASLLGLNIAVGAVRNEDAQAAQRASDAQD